jgi:fructose-1,6-bisphosphatase/inositol monophosphatase family enzyme
VTDTDSCVAAVNAAGSVAAADFGRPTTVVHKKHHFDILTQTDEQAQAAAIDMLRSRHPHDGVTAEEGGVRIDGPRMWYVDPIDGSVNFVSGIDLWCSAVALPEVDRPTAAVYAPSRDELFVADGTRCSLNGGPLDGPRAVGLHEASLAVYLRPYQAVPTPLTRCLHAAGTTRMLGSGTLELAWVAAGRIDGWIQYNVAPWDWHPGATLVRAAGGVAEVLEAGDTQWFVAGSERIVSEMIALVDR